MSSRRSTVGQLAVVLCALVSATLASSPARADVEAPARAIASVGVAIPLVNHRLYDVGVVARGGADLPVGNRRLIVDGGWIGFATTGARVDAFLARASYRVSPSWARGVRFDFGSGLVLEVERVHLELPGQRVAMSTTPAGVPASIAIGMGFGRWVGLELGYQQLFYVNAFAHSAGIAYAALGGRL